VLVVGGGPAGSTCAWKLQQAGVNVLVIDRARFPREKPCAGWITPDVVTALDLSLDEYQTSGRTLQAITGFQIGLMERRPVDVIFGHPVSYGICRSEFDDYLLRRSGARVCEGIAVHTIRRRSGRWLINDAIEARLLVGAGGHFCPVARAVGGVVAHERVVAAREVEVRMTAAEASGSSAPGGVPELRFCRDLRGYGWIIRKGDVLNVGLGREDIHQLTRHVSRFVATLDPSVAAIIERGHWRGHAYVLRQASARAVVGEGMLLVGDAAGLAHARSGEGIGPAVESGLLAADAIVAAGDDGHRALQRYEEMLDDRFPRATPRLPPWMPEAVMAAAARHLFTSAWLARRVVIDRWFLHHPREKWRS
jgi:flavin-dependent dehydrogenase